MIDNGIDMNRAVPRYRATMMGTSLILTGFMLLCFSINSTSAMSAEVKSTTATKSEKQVKPKSQPQTLVIQSQVKGSQEQPNVIYIMPWQGVDKVIEVKGKKRTISLPNFKPINPRDFKEQVRLFANKQVQLTSGALKNTPRPDDK